MSATAVPTGNLDRPWVLGIRRPKAREWLSRVASLLLHTFVNVPSGASTAAAETGLGFAPSSYWYICRSESDFGHIVFLWSEDDRVVFDSKDGAVTPFDTGGVWHGHVRMNPILPADERRSFVALHSRSTSDWRVAFETWIQANYNATAEYIVGVPPQVGVPGIVYDRQNGARAWTWEARLEKASYRRQIAVRHIFWTAEDRLAFENWLEAGGEGLDVKIAEDLLELVAATTIETPRTTRVHEEVVGHLLKTVADE